VPARGDSPGFGEIAIARALAAGLAFRPLAETAADTLAWWRTLPEERRAKPKAGLSPEREREVLSAWKARAG
jgi:2'-hydroxyisoflavone reductase